MGPLLTTADAAVMTKEDLVSQAEREVFRERIIEANPRCRIIEANGLSGRAEKIAKLLACPDRGEEIVGVLDGQRASIALAPLPGEASCREDLHPFNPVAYLQEGDVFRCHPQVCPTICLARPGIESTVILHLHITL